jgi:anti-sigma B factor antagonist
LDLRVEETPTEWAVRCIGRITAETAELLRDTVRRLTASNKNVALDLTAVDFIDSSGLGTVVGLFVSARRTGCNLRLTDPNDKINSRCSWKDGTQIIRARRLTDSECILDRGSSDGVF